MEILAEYANAKSDNPQQLDLVKFLQTLFSDQENADIITKVNKANDAMEIEKYGQTLAPARIERNDPQNIKKTDNQLVEFFSKIQAAPTEQKLVQTLAAKAASESQTDTTYKSVKKIIQQGVNTMAACFQWNNVLTKNLDGKPTTCVALNACYRDTFQNAFSPGRVSFGLSYKLDGDELSWLGVQCPDESNDVYLFFDGAAGDAQPDNLQQVLVNRILQKAGDIVDMKQKLKKNTKKQEDAKIKKKKAKHDQKQAERKLKEQKSIDQQVEEHFYEHWRHTEPDQASEEVKLQHAPSVMEDGKIYRVKLGIQDVCWKEVQDFGDRHWKTTQEIRVRRTGSPPGSLLCYNDILEWQSGVSGAVNKVRPSAAPKRASNGDDDPSPIPSKKHRTDAEEITPEDHTNKLEQLLHGEIKYLDVRLCVQMYAGDTVVSTVYYEAVRPERRCHRGAMPSVNVPGAGSLSLVSPPFCWICNDLISAEKADGNKEIISNIPTNMCQVCGVHVCKRCELLTSADVSPKLCVVEPSTVTCEPAEGDIATELAQVLQENKNVQDARQKAREDNQIYDMEPSEDVYVSVPLARLQFTLQGQPAIAVDAMSLYLEMSEENRPAKDPVLDMQRCQHLVSVLDASAWGERYYIEHAHWPHDDAETMKQLVSGDGMFLPSARLPHRGYRVHGVVVRALPARVGALQSPAVSNTDGDLWPRQQIAYSGDGDGSYRVATLDAPQTPTLVFRDVALTTEEAGCLWVCEQSKIAQAQFDNDPVQNTFDLDDSLQRVAGQHPDFLQLTMEQRWTLHGGQPVPAKNSRLRHQDKTYRPVSYLAFGTIKYQRADADGNMVAFIDMSNRQDDPGALPWYTAETDHAYRLGDVCEVSEQGNTKFCFVSEISYPFSLNSKKMLGLVDLNQSDDDWDNSNDKHEDQVDLIPASQLRLRPLLQRLTRPLDGAGDTAYINMHGVLLKPRPTPPLVGFVSAHDIPATVSVRGADDKRYIAWQPKHTCGHCASVLLQNACESPYMHPRTDFEMLQHNVHRQMARDPAFAPRLKENLSRTERAVLAGREWGGSMHQSSQDKFVADMQVVQTEYRKMCVQPDSLQVRAAYAREPDYNSSVRFFYGDLGLREINFAKLLVEVTKAGFALFPGEDDAKNKNMARVAETMLQHWEEFVQLRRDYETAVLAMQHQMWRLELYTGVDTLAELDAVLGEVRKFSPQTTKLEKMQVAARLELINDDYLQTRQKKVVLSKKDKKGKTQEQVQRMEENRRGLADEFDDLDEQADEEMDEEDSGDTPMTDTKESSLEKKLEHVLALLESSVQWNEDITGFVMGTITKIREKVENNTTTDKIKKNHERQQALTHSRWAAAKADAETALQAMQALCDGDDKKKTTSNQKLRQEQSVRQALQHYQTLKQLGMRQIEHLLLADKTTSIAGLVTAGTPKCRLLSAYQQGVQSNFLEDQIAQYVQKKCQLQASKFSMQAFDDTLIQVQDVLAMQDRERDNEDTTNTWNDAGVADGKQDNVADGMQVERDYEPGSSSDESDEDDTMEEDAEDTQKEFLAKGEGGATFVPLLGLWREYEPQEGDGVLDPNLGEASSCVQDTMFRPGNFVQPKLGKFFPQTITRRLVPMVQDALQAQIDARLTTRVPEDYDWNSSDEDDADVEDEEVSAPALVARKVQPSSVDAFFYELSTKRERERKEEAKAMNRGADFESKLTENHKKARIDTADHTAESTNTENPPAQRRESHEPTSDDSDTEDEEDTRTLLGAVQKNAAVGTTTSAGGDAPHVLVAQITAHDVRRAFFGRADPGRPFASTRLEQNAMAAVLACHGKSLQVKVKVKEYFVLTAQKDSEDKVRYAWKYANEDERLEVFQNDRICLNDLVHDDSYLDVSWEGQTWTAMVRDMQAAIEQNMPETNLNAYQRLSLPAAMHQWKPSSDVDAAGGDMECKYRRFETLPVVPGKDIVQGPQRTLQVDTFVEALKSLRQTPAVAPGQNAAVHAETGGAGPAQGDQEDPEEVLTDNQDQAQGDQEATGEMMTDNQELAPDNPDQAQNSNAQTPVTPSKQTETETMQQDLEDMQDRAALCLSWDGVEQKKIDWGEMPFPVGACVQITWLEDGSSNKENRFRPRQIAHVLNIDLSNQTVFCRVEGSKTTMRFEREGLKKFKLFHDGTGAYIKEFDMQEPPLTIIMENNPLKLYKQKKLQEEFVFQWTSFTQDKRFGVVVDETIVVDPFVTGMDDVLLALEHGIEHSLLFPDEKKPAHALLDFFDEDVVIEQKLAFEVEETKTKLDELFTALTFTEHETYNFLWEETHGLHGAKLKQIYNAHVQRLIDNLIRKATAGKRQGLLNSKFFQAYQSHMTSMLEKAPTQKTPPPSKKMDRDEYNDVMVRLYKRREARFAPADSIHLRDDEDEEGDNEDAHKYDVPMAQVCWYTPVEASGIPLFLFTERISQKDLGTKNYTVGSWNAPDQHTPQFYMGDCLDYGGQEYIPTCLDLPRMLCAGSDNTLDSRWRQSEIDAGEEVRFPSVYMTRERLMTMVPWLSTNPDSLLLLRTIPKSLRKLLTAAADVFVASSTDAQQVTDAIWNTLEQKKKTTVSARHKHTVEDFVGFLQGMGTQTISSTKKELKSLLETSGDGARQLRDEIRKRVPPAVLEEIKQMFVVKDKVNFKTSHKTLTYDPVFGILMFLHQELLAEFWEDYEHDDGEASDDDGEDGANMVVDDQWDALDELDLHPILRHQKRRQDTMQKKHGGDDVDMQDMVAAPDVLADDFEVSNDENAEAAVCATLVKNVTEADASLVLFDDRHDRSFSRLFMQRMGVLGQHRAGVSLPSPQNATGLDSEDVLRGLLCFLGNVSPKMFAQGGGEVLFQCLLALCAQAMEILLRMPKLPLLWDVWQACLKLCCSAYLRETEGGTEERALYYFGEGYFHEADYDNPFEALNEHIPDVNAVKPAIKNTDEKITLKITEREKMQDDIQAMTDQIPKQVLKKYDAKIYQLQQQKQIFEDRELPDLKQQIEALSREIEQNTAERETNIPERLRNMTLGIHGYPLFSVRSKLGTTVDVYNAIIRKLEKKKQDIESKLQEKRETLTRAEGEIFASPEFETIKNLHTHKQALEQHDTLIATLEQQKRAEESKLADYSMPELNDTTVMTWTHQDPSTNSARQTALQKKLAGGPLDHPSRPSQNPFFDDTLTLRLGQPEVMAATPKEAEYERLMHMLRVRAEQSQYHPYSTALLWDLTDDATNDATHPLVLLYVDHVFRRQATNVTDMHAVTETYFFTHEKFADQRAIEQCQRLMRERLKDAALYFAHKDRDIIQWVQGDDEVAFFDEHQQRATAAPVNSRTEQGVRIVREKADRSSSTEVLRVNTSAKLTSVAVASVEGTHVVAVGDSSGTVHFLQLDGNPVASIPMAANSRVLSVNFDAGATSLAVVCADAVDDDARNQGVTDKDSLTVTQLTAPQGWLAEGGVEKGVVERGRDHEYTQELTSTGVMKPQGPTRISHASFALPSSRVYKPVAKPYSQFWTNSAVQGDASSDLAQVRRQTEVEMWRQALLRVAQAILFGDEPGSMQSMSTHEVAKRIHDRTGYDVFLLHSSREVSARGAFVFRNVVAGRPSSAEAGERTIFGGVVQVEETGPERVVCITSEASEVPQAQPVIEEESDGEDEDFEIEGHKSGVQSDDAVGAEANDSSDSEDDSSEDGDASMSVDAPADDPDAMQEARSVAQSRSDALSHEAYCGDYNTPHSMYPAGYVPVQPLYYQAPPPNTAPGQGYYVPVQRRSWW